MVFSPLSTPLKWCSGDDFMDSMFVSPWFHVISSSGLSFLFSLSLSWFFSYWRLLFGWKAVGFCSYVCDLQSLSCKRGKKKWQIFLFYFISVELLIPMECSCSFGCELFELLVLFPNSFNQDFGPLAVLPVNKRLDFGCSTATHWLLVSPYRANWFSFIMYLTSV